MGFEFALSPEFVEYYCWAIGLFLAVSLVMLSSGFYQAMVVTNAADFTEDAVRLAKREGVRLIPRDCLWQLRTLK